MPVARSDLQELEAVLAGSLGPWSEHAGALARALRAGGHGLAALEASIRGGAGPVSGGRMMIERVDAASAEAILGALPVALESVARLIALAPLAPLIAGWDTARSPGCAKVYLNLSDASVSVRERAARALGLPGAPHVVGANFGTGGVEWKLYHQLDVLPPDTPDVLRRFAEDLPIAGIARSVDVLPDGSCVSRAIFAGPRQDVELGERLAALPGWDARRTEAALPFAPGLVRQVGASADGRAWTLYVKPRGSGSELWRLDPEVCVRGAGGEIGIHVTPREASQRAYARTARHAVSYRLREGELVQRELERVMQWAVGVVAEAEERGEEGARRWEHPPEGFRVVDR